MTEFRKGRHVASVLTQSRMKPTMPASNALVLYVLNAAENFVLTVHCSVYENPK